MAETHVISQRPDVDIQDDIGRLIVRYPPLQKDRYAIQTQVVNGTVMVSGHVQTPITRHYFLSRLTSIPGVVAVHADQFYDDETIRIEAGKMIPVGVILGKVFYGTAVLSGELPSSMSADEVAAQVARVPGVLRVVTDFGT
jgi:osmotically-inducible protein OsmY